MRAPSLALMIAVLSAAAPARALDLPPLCKALHELGDQARSSGAAQRISADVALADAAACRPVTANAATAAFCDTASREAGLAWRLQDCVETLAASPQITTRPQHAERRSRNAITHLAAGLAHGARLDLTETGGRYDIVVWAPK
jgi:hypothetical protein